MDISTRRRLWNHTKLLIWTFCGVMMFAVADPDNRILGLITGLIWLIMTTCTLIDKIRRRGK